jgi:four helix bundle protein
MSDADGEAAETTLWLNFVKDCGYLSPQNHKRLTNCYEEIGRMLGNMILHPAKFLPR